MLKTPEQRIWLAVVGLVLVVAAMGYYAFTSVPTAEHRTWQLGSVPFVPAKSHYSHERIEVGHLPNPEATIPPEKRGGGAR